MKIDFYHISKKGNKYEYIYHTKSGWLFFKKAIEIRFLAKYPHYNLGDILWMLEYTKQTDLFLETINNCDKNGSDKINIDIGTLKIATVDKVDMSKESFEIANYGARKLQKEWTEETGLNYPVDLGMPKRSLF